MRVNVSEGFKYAIDGIHVITVEPGEQDLHEQAANWAIANGRGKAVKEAKANASRPADVPGTGEYFPWHYNHGNWWVHDREGKVVNAEAMGKKDAHAVADKLNAEPGPNPLDQMSLEQLTALATGKGIALDANETKADLIAKIEKADADAKADAGGGEAGNG